MRVKRYVVDSMSDALQQIRSDLGKDAIILNTKSVKTGGFLGMFRKKQIEVIAAVDPAETKEKPSVRKPFAEPAPKLPLVQTAPVPAAPLPSVTGNQAAAREPVHNEERFAETFKNTLSLQANKTIVPAAETGKPDGLTKELEEMKGMLWKLVMADGNTGQAPAAFSALRKQLVKQEVEEEIITSIFEKVLKQLLPEDIHSEQKVAAMVKEVLLGMINQSAPKSGSLRQETRFVHFVGPTGVGKTTTLAKLAADSVIGHRRKVGMLTSDTYRIAAVEQLKTYANILNLPLKVIYSVEDLAPSIERLSDCNLLFMDTAGRNYRIKEYVTEIEKLLASGLPSETFLVLSLTSKYSDMEAIVQSFENIQVDKVIFTKIDETRTYGAILNLVVNYKLALSYFTTGQNVPDDIEIAAPDKIVSLLLGEYA
jgi:flagellar biosynthesis protein FlhF